MCFFHQHGWEYLSATNPWPFKLHSIHVWTLKQSLYYYSTWTACIILFCLTKSSKSSSAVGEIGIWVSCGYLGSGPDLLHDFLPHTIQFRPKLIRRDSIGVKLLDNYEQLGERHNTFALNGNPLLTLNQQPLVGPHFFISGFRLWKSNGYYHIDGVANEGHGNLTTIHTIFSVTNSNCLVLV